MTELLVFKMTKSSLGLLKSIKDFRHIISIVGCPNEEWTATGFVKYGLQNDPERLAILIDYLMRGNTFKSQIINNLLKVNPKSDFRDRTVAKIPAVIINSEKSPARIPHLLKYLKENETDHGVRVEAFGRFLDMIMTGCFSNNIVRFQQTGHGSKFVSELKNHEKTLDILLSPKSFSHGDKFLKKANKDFEMSNIVVSYTARCLQGASREESKEFLEEKYQGYYTCIRAFKNALIEMYPNVFLEGIDTKPAPDLFSNEAPTYNDTTTPMIDDSEDLELQKLLKQDEEIKPLKVVTQ